MDAPAAPPGSLPTYPPAASAAAPPAQRRGSRSLGPALGLVGAFLLGSSILSQTYYAWWTEQVLSTGNFDAVRRLTETSNLVTSIQASLGVLFLGLGWAASRLRGGPSDSARSRLAVPELGWVVLGLVGVGLISASTAFGAGLAALELAGASIRLPIDTAYALTGMIGTGIVIWGLGAFLGRLLSARRPKHALPDEARTHP